MASFCQLWKYSTPCSSVSIVNFELVNASWDMCMYVIDLFYVRFFVGIIYYFYSMFTLLSGFDSWRTSRTYVRLLLLAYALFWTCVRWHVRSFFPYDFQNFSGSYNFITFKNLLLYISPLIYLLVSGKDRFFTA